jgi:outer membrane beta-barrel protein
MISTALCLLLVAAEDSSKEPPKDDPKADTARELDQVTIPEESEGGPDGTVTAIQDRNYHLKAELGVGVGFLPLDPFTRGVTISLSYTHHFTDHFAWRVGRGFFSFGFATGLKTQLEQRYSVAPTDLDRVEWAAGSDLVLTPFYGKVALFNRAVMWMELYLLAGGSVFKFTSGFKPGAGGGGGFRAFITQNLSVRLEVVDHVAFPRPVTNVLEFGLVLAFNFGGNDRSPQ